MDALAGYGGSSSDSSEDDRSQTPPKAVSGQPEAAVTGRSSSSSALSPRKRQRRWDNAASSSDAAKHNNNQRQQRTSNDGLLPPVPTCLIETDGNGSSSIAWFKDYLAQAQQAQLDKKQQQQQQKPTAASTSQQAKPAQPKWKIDPKITEYGYAQDLQQQHAFHNPYVLAQAEKSLFLSQTNSPKAESEVEPDANESATTTDTLEMKNATSFAAGNILATTYEALEDWETAATIAQREEQARIQQQLQQQATTGSLAFDDVTHLQIQQAMQQRRGGYNFGM